MPPLTGHKSGRAGLSFGIAGDSVFEEVSLRPALQDLAGDHTGYLSNSHLEMFHLKLRFGAGRVSIEKLALIEIVSITPQDSWIKKASWKGGTGLYTAKELKCERCLYYGISAGRGVSLKTRLWNQEVYYLLAELDTGFGGVFRDNHGLGRGMRAGALVADAFQGSCRRLRSGGPTGQPSGNDGAGFHVRQEQRCAVGA